MNTTVTECVAGPDALRTLTTSDWQNVITNAAALGIPQVQLIGGEPTTHPGWIHLVNHALGTGRRVEVYSNLFHVQPAWWELFSRPGVSLATSYYSDMPAEHDEITRCPGSHARTRAHIVEAVRRSISLRTGIIHVLNGQRVEQARAELLAFGVARVGVDRTRAVGVPPTAAATLTSRSCAGAAVRARPRSPQRATCGRACWRAGCAPATSSSRASVRS